ncbi:MAG: 1-acyl-sn-glycerol-3-phosphate acyltransferase [Betaproteobacteria bacterium]|nr:1-acyl-sn-glycerol-3-phosphate acyltransferase [Betaproteobacteria bacterium]
MSLPLWLVVLGALLAAWSLVASIMLPGVRWVLRSRANKVLDEVSSRLRIEIRPFQQTRRQALIDLLAYDAKVQEAVAAQAKAQGMTRELVTARVRGYAREIVPALNAYVYFRLGYWAARNLAQSLYRVRLGYADTEGLARIAPDATVIFVMNHRSNMDYILAAYLAADQAALSYAVGEWARVWPLQQLIRSMGAYFVRRNSRDQLYRRGLERYVAMATEAGGTQALYPEGGLSRNGLIGEPRLGVLDYMLRNFNPEGGRDIVFVPLGLNYDRVLEDRTLLLAGDARAKKPGLARAAANTLGFVAHQAALMLRSKWLCFGYACVNFGTPISMREYTRQNGFDFRRLGKEERFARVAELASYLMISIGRLIPVLPVPLVASVFAAAPEKRFSELELKAAAEALIEKLEARGAHIYIPRRDRDYAIGAGLQMLQLRHLVEEDEGLYGVASSELALLRYYANSIAHLR